MTAIMPIDEPRPRGTVLGKRVGGPVHDPPTLSDQPALTRARPSRLRLRNQIARINAQSLRESPEDRDARRNSTSLNRTEITRTQPGPICQFFLRHFSGMAFSTQIRRHISGPRDGL
jgi:hypothetical protein